MIRNALILAAGRGFPVGEPGSANCLAAVGGISLILRTLRVLKRGGIDRVAITTGWSGDELRARVEEMLAKDRGLPREVLCFENVDWQKPNGVSVLAAGSF